MSRYLIPVATVATIGAIAWAAEMQSPGFWLIFLAYLAEFTRRAVDALEPIALLAVVGWLSWKASAYVTERDTLQAVAEAAGRKNRKADAHPEAEWN